ncbi:DgyrCDS1238 [Dimorphilus gyrociliatus]|uniref:DgyrCDS1238 n=1 Tax=Dimorphilus gyrociliatus TaxID=2664684 RepID=A0A7I8V8I2_9ANNE|nr:DgyrCDS1238 [Dimorphilus gyrociliatus]
MDGLPFLPGNTFCDPTKSRYHVSHSLGYKNGYQIASRPNIGIGGEPIRYNTLSEQELDDLAQYKPTLTYGPAKQAPPEDFVPAHVAFDKKVLRFSGWYKQTVHESPNEHYRVRHVQIYYYLEDDSIAVVEPPKENSGMPQGKLIKRQRLPKNDVGDYWLWKDLNVGMNVTFYGKVFHIYDCDQWTRGFLHQEGINVNPPEDCPTDPYLKNREESAALKTYKTPTDFDKLRQFLEMDRKVLRFYCVWDDRDSMFGEMNKYVIHYYLVDDTLEVRECHSANNGRDPFPVLIQRQKVPVDRYNVPSTFPGIVMELSQQEIKRYFTPSDFAIGKTVLIFNRKFFIYDVDPFTKAFYWKNFGVTDFTPVELSPNGVPLPKMEIAPYNGFGSLEDSMQSCLSLVPEQPKKDFIKMLENDGKQLRFEASLDTPNPDDKLRRFIITYRLADDMITIHEPPKKNSGIIGGKFLERSRVAKPNSTPSNPQYYGPADFYIGASIEIFKHRFIITNADLYVLKYMEEHPNRFPETTVQSLRQTLGQTGAEREMRKGGPIHVKRTYEPGELQRITGEVKQQLQKTAITAPSRKDAMFLGADTNRVGYISRQNLKELLIKHHLPCDDDIVNALATELNPENPDCIDLEVFRKFFEA